MNIYFKVLKGRPLPFAQSINPECREDDKQKRK